MLDQVVLSEVTPYFFAAPVKIAPEIRNLMSGDKNIVSLECRLYCGLFFN